MAEIIGITAGISNLLKALGSSGVYLKGAFSASREAQEIASQVHATEAILKSLKASLKTIHRSNEFYENWSGSTKLVVHNVKITIDELNRKLGSQRGTTRLNFWAKLKWPLARDDTQMLQKQMEAYMQMLSMVQNAFMQGTIQSVQQSARNIDDIFTEIGTLPSSSSPRSSVAWSASSISSSSTIVPSDSASQIGRTRTTKPIPSLEIVTSSVLDPLGPNLALNEGFVFGNITLTVNPRDGYDQGYLPSGGAYYEHSRNPLDEFNYDQRSQTLPEKLGSGEIRVTLSHDRCLIWLIFKPRGLERYESRWFVKAQSSIYNSYEESSLVKQSDRNNSRKAQQQQQQQQPQRTGTPEPYIHSYGSYGSMELNLFCVIPDVKENNVASEQVRLTFSSGDTKSQFINAWGKQIQTGKAEIERLEQEKVVKQRASRMVARPTQSYRSI